MRASFIIRQLIMIIDSRASRTRRNIDDIRQRARQTNVDSVSKSRGFIVTLFPFTGDIYDETQLSVELWSLLITSSSADESDEGEADFVAFAWFSRRFVTLHGMQLNSHPCIADHKEMSCNISRRNTTRWPTSGKLKSDTTA